MFEKCPLSVNKDKICEFGIIREGVNYCGLADSQCDPVGESKILHMKYCPLEKMKERKRKAKERRLKAK